MALVACAIVLALLPHSVRAADAVVRPDSIVRPDSLRPAIQRMLPPDSMRRLSDPKWRARMAVQQRDSSSAATTAQQQTAADSTQQDSARQDSVVARLAAFSDSLTQANLKAEKKKARQRERFVPDPKRALWLAIVLPGGGQIYNRKYWKLPFIYGGFLGCTYAFMWNQQMYRDYSQAYLDIMDDDPNTKSYMDMLPPRFNISGREEQFKALFKRKKDYYRRYRDLSAFCFAGVYLLSIVDAYVDAQLSVFDINPDLSLHLEPAVIPTGGSPGSQRRAAYGVGCSLHF